MIDLVYLKNDQAVCSSLTVAEHFEKQHKNVIRAIENIMEGMAEIEQTPTLFKKTFYIEKQNGQRYPMYPMNRDGFALLVMGFTGKEALKWKLQYIKAFNAMEHLLMEKSTAVYAECRLYGKLTREAETAVIRDLVEYARAQGSRHPEKLYLIYSRLANRTVGIKNRELATIEQLSMLNFMENVILNRISLGMMENKPYKEIYADCKKHTEVLWNEIKPPSAAYNVANERRFEYGQEMGTASYVCQSAEHPEDDGHHGRVAFPAIRI